MMERIAANDVLDVNARVVRSFTGTIVGHFRQVGPNAWDEFEFVERSGGLVEVMAGLQVQAEDNTPTIRMRYHGEVVRVAWPTEAAEPAEHGTNFRAVHLAPLGGSTLLGAAALIARKLQEPPPNLDT